MISHILSKQQQGAHVVILADEKNASMQSQLQGKIVGSRVVTDVKNIKNALVMGKVNWVIVESNSVAFISNTTRALNALLDAKYQIIMATTQRGDAYDDNNVSNSHLSNLTFHYPTVDKLSSEKNTFAMKYESQYGGSPNRYAIRGFDITMDAILRMASQGDLYKAAKKVGETHYIENKFKYDRKLHGGYYNTGVYIVKYQDLEIVEAQ